jgi:hypothetical protein
MKATPDIENMEEQTDFEKRYGKPANEVKRTIEVDG